MREPIYNLIYRKLPVRNHCDTKTRNKPIFILLLVLQPSSHLYRDCVYIHVHQAVKGSYR